MHWCWDLGGDDDDLVVSVVRVVTIVKVVGTASGIGIACCGGGGGVGVENRCGIGRKGGGGLSGPYGVGLSLRHAGGRGVLAIVRGGEVVIETALI